MPRRIAPVFRSGRVQCGVGGPDAIGRITVREQPPHGRRRRDVATTLTRSGAGASRTASHRSHDRHLKDRDPIGGDPDSNSLPQGPRSRWLAERSMLAVETPVVLPLDPLLAANGQTLSLLRRWTRRRVRRTPAVAKQAQRPLRSSFNDSSTAARGELTVANATGRSSSARDLPIGPPHPAGRWCCHQLPCSHRWTSPAARARQTARTDRRVTRFGDRKATAIIVRCPATDPRVRLPTRPDDCDTANL